MEENTRQLLISLLAGYITKINLKSILNIFQKAFQKKPELETELKTAKTPSDFERVFREAVGVIDALAGSGSIEIDNSSLEALRGIRFNHQNGNVTIAGSKLSAPLLQTGGTGSGQTEITNSMLKSQGTQISAIGSAKINIKGDAKISQS